MKIWNSRRAVDPRICRGSLTSCIKNVVGICWPLREGIDRVCLIVVCHDLPAAIDQNDDCFLAFPDAAFVGLNISVSAISTGNSPIRNYRILWI
jgi:hypothetical protein